MDANNTRFHLLLGEHDWTRRTQRGQASCQPDAPATSLSDHDLLEWDGHRAELRLRSEVYSFPTADADRLPTLSDRRGVGRDQYGNWYWIDPTQSAVLVRSAGSNNVATFWPVAQACVPAESTRFRAAAAPAPSQPQRLAGLAVTTHHYLVVGTLNPAGLLVFDLHTTGEPRRILWPQTPATPFVPFDMAPMPGGGVWILDRKNKRYWGLDSNFALVADGQPRQELRPAADAGFQPNVTAGAPQPAVPVGSRPPRTFPTGIDLAAAPGAPAAINPVAIEALPDGSVLILNRRPANRPTVLHYRFERLASSLEPASPTDHKLSAHDLAFLPAPEQPAGAGPHRLGELLLVADKGNQVLAFPLQQEVDGSLKLLDPAPDYLPLRRFGGRALVADWSTTVDPTTGDPVPAARAWYDFDGEAATRWLPLSPQQRERYVTAGTLYTPAFDGRSLDCVWHRLVIDGCIPAECAVQIASRTANVRAELDDPEAGPGWQLEPALYRRGDGSELPYQPGQRARSTDDQRTGSWELLFQRAEGRFLQLKICVLGNGRATPRLRALRAYYPRFSYLTQYFPACYQENAASASFLGRFLALFEGMFTAIEDRIAAAQVLFDVRSAPAEALDWLAQWLGLVLDPSWSEGQRRLMIRHALDFYQFRGTAFGIKMALRLVWEPNPDAAIFKLRPTTAAEQLRAEAIRIAERPPAPATRTERRVQLACGNAASPTPDAAPTAPAVPAAPVWTPDQPGAALNLRYATSVSAPAGATTFPVQQPTTGGEAWANFALAALGFVPAAGDQDLATWQYFLEQRYQGIESYIKAYSLRATTPGAALPLTFADIHLPQTLPADGPPLQDWYLFETKVLPQRRQAHRFTVQLPVRYGGQRNVQDYGDLVALVRRIVAVQKPAHTIFDVAFYWSMFRTGEARLGQDTLIGLGSRAPELLPPMSLGQGYLAESTLEAGYPQNLQQRAEPILTARLGRYDLTVAPSPAAAQQHGDFIVLGRDRVRH